MAPPAGIRRLGNWIESYEEYTEILPSPALFRKWVAIFFVAAAMERRVWVRTMGSALYPNLYVLLVGPPGIGKGVAMHPAEAMMRDVPEIHVGPSDMTTASMIDALNESVRRVIILGGNPPFDGVSLTHSGLQGTRGAHPWLGDFADEQPNGYLRWIYSRSEATRERSQDQD